MGSIASLDYCTVVDGECRDLQTSMTLRSRNTSNLLKIQQVMSLMEGKTYTLDEVLERVIRFYRKHVPFN